jgi:hypothetical protein
MARAQQPTQGAVKKEAGNAAPRIGLAAVKPSDVAARAYELWQQSGCLHGKDQEHWFRAEQELTRKPAR